MLSVAGHLTIFQTRTRGPFWSIRPAPVLWMAVLGTQLIATLIAVYGFLMTPIGWGWAAFVWGYALAWFFVTDPVKLLAYRILDPPSDNAESAVRLKPQAVRKAPLEGTPRTATDLKPQIAMRAYELYERRGRQDGRAVQDWEAAEGQIRKERAAK
jgi:H+-transporting ATPase